MLLSAAAPSGLTATPLDDNDVQVTWTPDPSDGTQFEVDRQNADGSWVALATVDDSVDGDTYTDMGLSGATTYAYRVRADDGTVDGTSPFAGPASATTPLTTPDAPTSLTATDCAGNVYPLPPPTVAAVQDMVHEPAGGHGSATGHTAYSTRNRGRPSNRTPSRFLLSSIIPDLSVGSLMACEEELGVPQAARV